MAWTNSTGLDAKFWTLEHTDLLVFDGTTLKTDSGLFTKVVCLFRSEIHPQPYW